MRFLIFIFILGFSACDDSNSTSSDKFRYGKNSSTAQNENAVEQNLLAASSVITNRCTSCHSQWANYHSDEDWIKSGFVHRGDPDNSPLIMRIINSGSRGADMPHGSSGLLDDEYQTLRSWVESMP